MEPLTRVSPVPANKPTNNENVQQKSTAITNNKTTSDQFKEYELREHFIIFKNIILIGLAFMIFFTAFWGTSNLQSSLHPSMGATTLAVMYGSIILSNIFLPMTVISWFGCRMTMAISMFAYMPYIAAQFYPRFGTLIPAAILVGFGGGPLWCSKCTYLSVVAVALTYVRGRESQQEVNTVKLFGLFFIFYQMAQVWGNLISSTVLSSNIADDIDYERNSTIAELCGANFCPGISVDILPNLTPPDPAKVRLLNGIYLGCMFLAVLIIIFGVNSLERYGVTRHEASNGLSGLKLLTASIKLFRKRRQLLMIPITMFIGWEQAFLAVDFTKSFVACGWGISNIGFAMICFGVANAISAGIGGTLISKIGRIWMAMICAILNLSLFIYMYIWEARESDYWHYFAFAAIWGICDGIWLVLVNAFYGILFPKDLIAAYSNFRLCESTGSLIGYSISAFLCTSTKLIILMCVVFLGFIGYGFTEHRFSKKQKDVEDRK